MGLSSPLGIEDLPADQARPLLAAWHDGAAALRPDFDAWASVHRQDPDLRDSPGSWPTASSGCRSRPPGSPSRPAVDRLAEVLAVAAAADRPVFVHPGPTAPATDPADVRPDWWAAVVDYPESDAGRLVVLACGRPVTVP